MGFTYRCANVSPLLIEAPSALEGIPAMVAAHLPHAHLTACAAFARVRETLAACMSIQQPAACKSADGQNQQMSCHGLQKGSKGMQALEDCDVVELSLKSWCYSCLTGGHHPQGVFWLEVCYPKVGQDEVLNRSSTECNDFSYLHSIFVPSRRYGVLDRQSCHLDKVHKSVPCPDARTGNNRIGSLGFHAIKHITCIPFDTRLSIKL